MILDLDDDDTWDAAMSLIPDTPTHRAIAKLYRETMEKAFDLDAEVKEFEKYEVMGRIFGGLK